MWLLFPTSPLFSSGSGLTALLHALPVTGLAEVARGHYAIPPMSVRRGGKEDLRRKPFFASPPPCSRTSHRVTLLLTLNRCCAAPFHPGQKVSGRRQGNTAFKKRRCIVTFRLLLVDLIKSRRRDTDSCRSSPDFFGDRRRHQICCFSRWATTRAIPLHDILSRNWRGSLSSWNSWIFVRRRY